MHVRDDIIDSHCINRQRLRPVGRLAGNIYCHTPETFEMVRPMYQPNAEWVGWPPSPRRLL